MEQLPVLIVDNRSPVCCRIMQFIYKSGGSDKFCFLSLNSEEGRRLLAKYMIPNHIKNFMVLVDNGKVFVNAGAFFESTRKLNGNIPVFYWYTILPEKNIKSESDKAKANFNED